MGDMDAYLVDNLLNRYALGDRSGMSPSPDGSLTVHIQAESPGGAQEANWLPTPTAGPCELALRRCRTSQWSLVWRQRVRGLS
jgi:hypothetical protein